MSLESPSTNREQRIERRRTQILDAASAVFAEHGFRNTTTKMIAEAAGIAEGTIYNYFENKDDLLMGLIDRLVDIESREALLNATLDEDFATAFGNILRYRLAVIRDDLPSYLAVLPELLISPALRERYWQKELEPASKIVAAHLEKRIAQGQMRPLDTHVTAHLMTSFMQGIQIMMLMDDTIRELMDQPDRAVQAFTDLFFKGLNPDNPEKG